MSAAFLTSQAQHVERQFDSERSNSLKDFLEQEKVKTTESKGLLSSNYDIFAIRRNDKAGVEIFGPKQVAIGSYTESAIGSYTESSLYGAATSPLPAFFSSVRALAAKAENIRQFSDSDVEYHYQVTHFWTEFVKLSQFLGVSASVSEIVAEFLTARLQFLKKDTPVKAIAAIADALSIVSEAKRLDSYVVEKVADALESGGIDPLAVDALRRDHA